MKKDSKIGSKVKGQIGRFSGAISEGMNKSGRRFFGEMLYGILAGQDIKLSNVARTLGEDIALIKTENRLSRHMAQMDMTEMVNEALIEKGKWEIGEETVMAVDLTDVHKKYGKKMEGLNIVWDGSEGKPGKGYEICEIVGAEVKGQKVVPLYSELYSSGMKEFESENAQILKGIDAVMEAVGAEKGIYVIDRGGDRKILLEGLLARTARFVIRLRGDRNVSAGEEVGRVIHIAREMKCRHTREVTIETKEGIRQKKILRLGAREILLPFWSVPVRLVVIKGWSEKPMMLLTNCVMDIGKEEFVQKILEIYLTRWKCEEGFRFIKQSYQMEDVRVRSLTALRNSIVFVHAAFYFISMVLGMKVKLNILLSKICEKAMRFFEIPSFKQYAIADGIYRALFGKGFDQKTLQNPPNENQPFLPLNCAY